MERLPPPPRRMRELMAAHLQEHGIESFQLARHVYLGGTRRPSQLLTWNPAKASFSCDKCPGEVFVTGEITDSIVASAQRWDAGLKPHLTGLTDPADRDQMTRRYLSGELNRERLRSLRGAAHRRTAAASRPTVEERRRNVQRWMLERYVKLGALERVLEAADELQRTDMDTWLALAFRPLALETLRKYWHDIDPQEKAQAKEVFRQRGRSQRRS